MKHIGEYHYSILLIQKLLCKSKNARLPFIVILNFEVVWIWKTLPKRNLKILHFKERDHLKFSSIWDHVGSFSEARHSKSMNSMNRREDFDLEGWREDILWGWTAKKVSCLFSKSTMGGIFKPFWFLFIETVYSGPARRLFPLQ